ncbi:porin family protein [SAR92 clade bacterium H455]|uniref:Porin family protein n=1 Tax=SAR92 clade bacterium H455 TaxID=2974818 RepID=A0ABY5TP99_9GAMM|nr:porin family protein [SAR92 clade bacterium H455]
MLKSVVIIFATATLSCASLACYGDSYASLQLGFHDYEETVSGTSPMLFDSSLTSLYGRLGKQYNENFSAEVRLGVGLGDDVYEQDGLDTGLKLSLRDIYGVYLRGGMQVTEKLYPYVIFGYTQATLELGDDSFDFHEDFGGVSYGVGVDLELKPELYTSIEYIHYFDTVGTELSAFSVGLTKSF